MEPDPKRERPLFVKGTYLTNSSTEMIANEPLNLIRIIRFIFPCKLEPVSRIMILKQAIEQQADNGELPLTESLNHQFCRRSLQVYNKYCLRA